MPYGYFDDSAFQSGSRYSANPVTSSRSPAGGYGGPNAGSPMMSPPSTSGGGGQPMGQDYGGYVQAAGQGLGAIAGDVSRQNQLGAAVAGMGNEIPADPSYMKAMLDQMGQEGAMLRESSLGARPREAARTAGARAAEQRGLGGPLAASVAASSENEAQSGYDRYRMGALQNARMNYIGLMGQYKAQVQARLAALQKKALLEQQMRQGNDPLYNFYKYAPMAMGTAIGAFAGGGQGAQLGMSLGGAAGNAWAGAMKPASEYYQYNPDLAAMMGANNSAFGAF